MTLKEVKNEIERRSDEAWRKWKKEGCMLSQGLSLGLAEAAELLEEVVPVGNPDTLTLKELAQRLRKIFRFRYLTVDYDFPALLISMWNEESVFGFSRWDRSTGYVGEFSENALSRSLNLSEYADENGEIDYSRCIVEEIG